MNEKIDRYLEEIRHYLPSSRGQEEIIEEIYRSITDKLKNKPEGGSDKEVEDILRETGEPIDVASRYSKGRPIIAPWYRKFLFLYTGILFSIHTGTDFISAITTGGVKGIRFFTESPNGIVEFLVSIPVNFVFDFGLVCLILMGMSRSNKKIRLFWPEKLFSRGTAKRVKPTIGGLIGKLVGLGILVYIIMFSEKVTSQFKGSVEEAITTVIIPSKLLIALLILAVIDNLAYLVRLVRDYEVMDIVSPLLKLTGLLIFVNLPRANIYSVNVIGEVGSGNGQVQAVAIVAIIFTVFVVITGLEYMGKTIMYIVRKVR